MPMKELAGAGDDQEQAEGGGVVLAAVDGRDGTPLQ